MRIVSIAGASVLAWAFASQPVVAQSKKIDLRTTEGVTAVKGQWKYHDVKIVEVDGKGPDGKPNKTYNIEPAGRAGCRSPTSTIVNGRRSRPRLSSIGVRPARSASAGTGSRSRSRPKATGKAVFFQTTVDDYGEVWVDGRLPRTPGKTARRSSRDSMCPTASSSRTPSRERSTRSPSSASTGRSRTPPPTGSSSATRYLDIEDKK